MILGRQDSRRRLHWKKTSFPGRDVSPASSLARMRRHNGDDPRTTSLTPTPRASRLWGGIEATGDIATQSRRDAASRQRHRASLDDAFDAKERFGDTGATVLGDGTSTGRVLCVMYIYIIYNDSLQIGAYGIYSLFEKRGTVLKAVRCQ
jgi:hypothetical protein